MPYEWSGNPLARTGTKCRLGSIQAWLMRIDPTMLGYQQLGHRWTPELRRSWLLIIEDEQSMRINGSPLQSLVLVNLMPEQAKREAEMLLEWASVYYDGEEIKCAAEAVKELPHAD